MEIQFSIQNEVRTLMITNPPIGVLVLMITAFTNAENFTITSTIECRYHISEQRSID